MRRFACHRSVAAPAVLMLSAGLALAQAPTGPTGATGATGPGVTRQPPAPLPQPADALEGRPISAVVLRTPVPGKPGEFAPLPAEAERLALNQVRAAAGTPLRMQTVMDDVSRLNRTSRFRSIRTEAQPLADGSVKLIYTLTEQAVIEDVQVVGNRLLSDQEILGGIGVISGTPLGRFEIDRGARQIEKMYQDKGYYAARVSVDERALEESSIILYKIVEDQPVRVTDIRFQGNTSFTRGELRSQIKTSVYFPVIESGPLDPDALAQDVDSLIRFYRDRGFRDVRVSVNRGVTISPDGREATVLFDIQEGPLYTIRSVQVLYGRADGVATPGVQQYRAEVLKNPQADLTYLTPEQAREIGRFAFSTEQVIGHMVLKPGDVFSDDKVRKSIAAIEEAYGKLGYILDQGVRGPATCRVEPREVRDEHKPEIDLLLFIEEGVPWKVGEVKVTGNPITKQTVIMTDVQLKPERPLDKTLLDESKKRLEQRNLFAPGSVRLTVQPPAAPGDVYRDVVVEVAETNTGKFNFGTAISSDGGVVGILGLEQRNFDIGALPSSPGDLFGGHAFRGGGQTASIQLMPGTERQTYALSLSDPSFLDTDYTASGSLAFTTREFRTHDEQRYGGSLGAGRRFGSVWVGNLFLRNEWVDLNRIDATAPKDVFDSDALHRISGLNMVLTRRTTNDAYRPSRGTILTLGAEQVGVLGGDYNFTKVRADATTYFTLYESFMGYRTVLKVESRLNWIPQGVDDAPIFERYFLGGSSFRGFGFRAVSPLGLTPAGAQTSEPVGGSFLYFLGAEINQPLYQDTISVVGFIDTGTVDTSPSLADYRASVGIGLRFYIRQLSPIPLAFDFGFPIMREDGDRKRIFTFSIDVPY